MQHPVTTEYGHGFDQINQTLEAVAELGMQALVFWPNVDAGSEDVAKGIRIFRELGRAHGFHFFRNLPPEEFVRLMAHCACMVGNSSAALREGSFLGTPAVTVGTRQQGRERGPNLVEVEHDRDAIADAIRDQIAHGPYERSHLFGDGTAGREDRRQARRGASAGAEEAPARRRAARGAASPRPAASIASASTGPAGRSSPRGRRNLSRNRVRASACGSSSSARRSCGTCSSSVPAVSTNPPCRRAGTRSARCPPGRARDRPS